MSKNDTTPGTGTERTGFEPGTYPLREAQDDALAEAFEEQGEETAEAVGEVRAALNGEGDHLTDEQLERVIEAASGLVALSETAALRVPVDGRADPDGDRRE
jgi:hypothetical protein